MKNRSCTLFMLITCICAVSFSLGEQKEFIALQRLVPRLYQGSDWTDEDKAVSDRHFAQFQEAAKSGQLILSGRTEEPNEKLFGIAIFRASDEAAARAFVKADPLV